MDKERPSRAALAENFAELTKKDGGVGAVAKLLNIGSGTVGRIKSCDVVQTDTLEKIADHYGVEVHQLFMPKLGAGVMPFHDLTAEEAGIITMFRAIKSADDRKWILTSLASTTLQARPVGAPIAPEHQGVLDRLSEEAERQHGQPQQRRRISKR